MITFASDVCIAELVDSRGQPVPAGTPSAKVLITSLYNLTQPLIRYELTDTLTAAPGTDRGGYLRAGVEGRDDGVLRYGDVSIHPHVVRTVLASSAAVTEYQVRQTEHGLDVAVIAGYDADQAALRAALTGRMRRAGLPEPEVTVRVVPGIARHPDTGKARRFIPLETMQAPTARRS